VIFWFTSIAATPQTWGEAIEVPLMIAVAEGLPIQADSINCPGANKVTQVP
jgi:hypothetical protein